MPDYHTVPVAPLRDPPPGFEGPLYRMWPWCGIIGRGAISVGVAAAAVDAAVHHSFLANAGMGAASFATSWSAPSALMRAAWTAISSGERKFP